ncbi:MAG TPA: oligosaccharide flippase family protein [Candidatus Cloacimonadota bacterium]|nr:oligosaccharide flippase family protein [Candidatus Cloacimonadota bacterium]HPT71965.1 oligosaccharide flippase family protein [Candidatus Cloacimonadota bacterium]
MNRFISFLRNWRHNRSSSSKKVLILASGTTIAQALNIIFVPIISRLYHPPDYAIFALFISIQTVLQAIATGKFEYAVMLPKKEKDSYALTLIATGILSILCFLVMLAVIFYRFSIADMLGNHALANWLWLLPFSLFIASSNDITNYWAIRGQHYKKLAMTRVSASFTKTAINIGYRIFLKGPGGLILGGFLSMVYPIIYLRTTCLRTLSKSQMKVTWKRIKSRLAKYRHFPLYTAPNSLLGVLSIQIPIVLISRFFSENALGSYSYALQIMNFPMTIIGAAVGQVFYQEFSDAIRCGGDSKGLLIKTWKRLAIMGILPLTLIFFWGGPIFSFVFGAQWAIAGRIAAIIAPSVLGTFISSPTSSATLALNLQKTTFFFGLAQIIYRPLALYYGYLHHNLFYGLYVLVVCDILMLVAYNYVIWRHLPKEHH